MDWEQFWNELLDKYKLKATVQQMDEVDAELGSRENIEQICHQIYDDYESWKVLGEKIRDDFWKIIDTFRGVHLHTSRVKTVDSLLAKVINKRSKMLLSKNNKYAGIRGDNYRDIVTDLIGIRLIINYRGHWKDIHEQIMKRFPYNPNKTYHKDGLLPHDESGDYQAEIPRVYYAEGDAIQEYIDLRLLTIQHENAYRSVHYIISFQGVYIELQVRTIYDEAWSDCNHSYVYKKDSHKSHIALEGISKILSQLTNLSNDIGEQMKDIYDESLIKIDNNKWETTQYIIDEWDKSIQRVEDIQRDIIELRNKMVVVMKEENNYDE